jgi:hypothetical protein
MPTDVVKTPNNGIANTVRHEAPATGTFAVEAQFGKVRQVGFNRTVNSGFSQLNPSDPDAPKTPLFR